MFDFDKPIESGCKTSNFMMKNSSQQTSLSLAIFHIIFFLLIEKNGLNFLLEELMLDEGIK